MIRRVFSFCLLVAVFAAIMHAHAQAAPKGPTDTIRAAVDEVLAIIKDPGMKNAATRQTYFERVENAVQPFFDFDEFSSRTVGPNWRSFTPEQKKLFSDAFSLLLRATYIEKLDGYSGEKVDYTGEVKSTKGDRAEVQTTVRLKDALVPVAYRMALKNDNWKVYDVIVEKISLVENYRGQFRELLNKGTPEALIERVVSKANEVRQQNAAGKQ